MHLEMTTIHQGAFGVPTAMAPDLDQETGTIRVRGNKICKLWIIFDLS